MTFEESFLAPTILAAGKAPISVGSPQSWLEGKSPNGHVNGKVMDKPE